MTRIEPAQLAALIANIGVIGGILLLAYELRQNNELMEAEARLNRTNMAIESWRFTAENGDLTELRELEKRGEALSSADTRRVDAAVMAIFVVIEWTFKELPRESSELNQVREVQRHNFANSPEYGRVWEARKKSFDPAFVQWMEDNVVDQ
ncbi:MAG: hypothetical protein KJO09_09055 [Gammaproteobacteria bacterium]|nr:hypothetical protein [Gammaproteobacteria bacterium]